MRVAKPAESDNRESPFVRRAYATLGLAELIPGLTRAAYTKKSPAGALLMTDWQIIVGPRLAQETSPKRLSAGQLTIACSGPVAMELQHMAGTLIDRINTHAGTRLVARLRFVQEALAPPLPMPPPLPTPATRTAPPRPIEGMEPGALNDALARLRAAILPRVGNLQRARKTLLF